MIHLRDINEMIEQLPSEEKGKVSDGFHTFDELYEHRIVLYIALCEALCDTHFIWRSKKHSDGSEWDGWFLLGVGDKEGEQITYHLPISKWDNCQFAHNKDFAPTFDGHTSEDVLNRLKQL